MRRGSITGLLAIVAIAGAVALGSWGLLRSGTGCALSQAACTRVLFIGNSYTSTNDLPAVFAALVRSGGGAAETRMMAPGGAFLADRVAEPAVIGEIAGTPWTAVVLQEQSMAPASRDTRPAMVQGVSALSLQALSAHARPVLLQTWAHLDGWPDLGMTYETMQEAIDAGYAEAAIAGSATVAPAGDAFRRARTEAPGIALWQPDGSHPTPAGTYLAACVLYAAIMVRSPVGLAETGGLSPGDAAMLQAIAAAATGR